MSNAQLKTPVVILGAGPAGLGAAHAFHEAGFDDWSLYEQAEAVGGLSRSIVDERGFTWDVGGHVVFSHYDYFTKLLDGLLPDGWLYHDRECWIRLKNRDAPYFPGEQPEKWGASLFSWVPYPFQNNIRHLPPDQCARCLAGMKRAAAGGRRTFSNFGELIDNVFGEGIGELFMRPYNAKVWACQPEEMDVGWIGERVAVPDVARVEANIAAGRDDVAWGPNNRFRFPRQGGTGAIWQAIAARLPRQRIHTGREAVAIDPAARLVRFADGGEVRYGTLISTIPLDRLAALAGRRDWIDLTSGLRRTDVLVIGVGLRGHAGHEIRTKCWMYFPDPQVPFYRLTHFSHYSPHNVPDIRHQWSLMAEISYPGTGAPDKKINLDSAVRDTIDALIANGLIESRDQVTHTFTHLARYGYPVPALGRDAILRAIQPQLYDLGILSRGRFGAWRYEVGNMDHSFMQGAEAAWHIHDGRAEQTVFGPAGGPAK